MTNEEAINRILDHMRVHGIGQYPHCYIKEALDIAIEALQKQIPKRPNFWENKYYWSPNPNDDWGFECPCCRNRDIDFPEHHCTCGQALDWSE